MKEFDEPRYRFGPLEQRGMIAGLKGSQVAVLSATGILLLVSLRVLSSGAGLVVACVLAVTGAAAAFVPIKGHRSDEWLPVLARWGTRSLSSKRWLAPTSVAGEMPLVEMQPEFPPPLAGLQILSHVITRAGERMGVVKDRRAGTYTGVLAVQGKSFALLDGPDKARRLASWAGILAGMAREGGLVHRLQWVERTVPDPGNEIGRYVKENIALPLTSPVARAYLEVVDEAGPVTQKHEVFIALQVDAGKAQRAIKAAGGGDLGACEILRRELTSLSDNLMNAEIAVEGALTPRLLAQALRNAFDPDSRNSLATIGTRDAERLGTSVVNAGPLVTDISWSTYRTDGVWHATYWIAEWPRIDVGPDFLAPLLLRTEAMRTIAVTMEPVSAMRAIRSVEAARTSTAADEELRNRAGFVTTSRRQREQESLAEHERDLSDGHAFYRFTGFVTVTAPTHEELSAACGEIEEAAGRSFLDIRRLNGQQDIAFTYGLPLCRGLK